MALDSQRVKKPAKKLRKIVKRISRVPSLEDVHDLRTNIRRVEATIGALSSGSVRNPERLQKFVTPLRKRAGKVRDMDVLTGFASNVDAGQDENCKIQLLEHLGVRRRKMAKRLYAEIAKNGRQLRKRLKKTSKGLDRFLHQQRDDKGDHDRPSAQATAAALTLRSELAKNPKQFGRENLHVYRLKVKELRNLLRMADHGAGEEFVKTLGKVKDAIGEWHDYEILLATAQKVLNHRNCQVLRELKNTSNERYEHALAAAQNLRKKYLQDSLRANHRGTTAPARSVLITIADMAA